MAEAYDLGSGANPGRPGTRVAIKQCTNIFGQLKEAKQMFRELYILRRLHESEHVIKLKDALAPRGPFGQPFRDMCAVTQG